MKKMKTARALSIAIALSTGFAPIAMSQTATQTVTYQVTAINQMSITGAAPTLIVNTATAGSAPTTATSSGITWAVTTNQTGAKISAAIPTVMPAGLTLSATMGAPAGATSAGIKPITTTAVDLVTGITKLNASGLTLTYSLDATTAAGVVASGTRVVTFTVYGGT
jgi:hypothetical protein